MKILWFLLIFLMFSPGATASIKRERINAYTWYAVTKNDITKKQELRMYVVDDVTRTYTLSITCIVPDKTITVTLTDLLSAPVLKQKTYTVPIKFGNRNPVDVSWYSWPDGITITRVGDVEFIHAMRTSRFIRIGSKPNVIQFNLANVSRTLGRVVYNCRK